MRDRLMKAHGLKDSDCRVVWAYNDDTGQEVGNLDAESRHRLMES